MKISVLRCLVIGAALVPAALVAQQPAPAAARPVVDAARSIIDRYGTNITAAAQAMPADKYGYAPTPQQRTFGAIVAHVAQSNNLMCANAASVTPPSVQVPAATAPKAELISALEASFAFCKTAIDKVDESKLADEVPFFGNRKISRAGLVLALTGDMFDHYSAMAVYLRLNGILPPTARPRQSM